MATKQKKINDSAPAGEKELKEQRKEQAKAELHSLLTGLLDESSANNDLSGGAEGVPAEAKMGNQPIGEEQIAEAYKILQKYKAQRTSVESRVIDNEQWWKMHCSRYDDTGKEFQGKRSAWLFNAISNKHADALDNTPTCNVLPREKDDKKAAEVLSEILPVIFENNQFDCTYSDIWYDKLKHGTGIYGIFWNPTLNNLGDVDIKRIDILSLFYEPGITDIQDSSNVFNVKLWNNDQLVATYPQMKDIVGNSPVFEQSRYIYDDSLDTSDKTYTIDWYYKRTTEYGRTVVHFCKFANGVVLYASENDPQYQQTGWYEHGMYPFVFDKLYTIQGQPSGFGLIDVMKDAQDDIDELGNCIMQNAKMAATRRYFVRGDGSINEEEFADWRRPFVHYQGSGIPSDNIMPIEVPLLHANYQSILDNKIQELKETSGNNDWSQGGTRSGVTAASAISALAELGSKLSRDMIKQSYKAYERVCNMVIWLIRQFYTMPRTFRIVGQDNGMEFVQFEGSQIGEQPLMVNGQPFGSRLPVYDVKVKAQKESPFSRISQNELGLQFFNMGLFMPQNADMAMPLLEMMEFEGKDAVMADISKNAMLPQLQRFCVMFATKLAQYDPKYKEIAVQMAQQFGLMPEESMQQEQAPTGNGSISTMNTDILGNTTIAKGSYQATRAAEKAREVASV